MAKQRRRFFEISGGAGTLKAGQWILNSADDAAEAIHTHYHLNHTLPIDNWPSEPPTYSYEAVGPLAPDVAWTFGNTYFVVSDRLRTFVEKHAPKHASFLPVRVKGPERKRLHAHYWAVQWRHDINCYSNPDVSEADVSRFPENVLVTQVPYSHWSKSKIVIVDGALKPLLDAERFVGLRTRAVKMDYGADELVPWKDPRNGKPIRIERKMIPSDRYFDPKAFFERFPPNTPDAPVRIDPFQSYVHWHSAFGWLREEHIRTLLQNGSGPGQAPKDPESPWQVVMRPKSPRLIRLLTKHGADWNVANSIGYTALMAAAAQLDEDAIRALIKCGARINARSRSGKTALDCLLETAEHEKIEKADLKRMVRLLTH